MRMWRTTSIIIGSVLILLTLGVIMVASTSGVRGEELVGDSFFFLRRQLLWLAAGIIACIFLARLDYHYLRPLAVPLAIFTAILLLMAVIPGVGVTVKGSSRWLRFGSFSVQPSELAKLAMIIMLAWWMSRVQHRASEFRRGLIVLLLCVGVMAGLIFIEPDFGTTMLVCVVGMGMMFVGGTRMGYLVIAAAIGLVGFILAVMQDELRMRRIIAFLNPDKYAQHEAFQLLNAKYAFVAGGGSGVGLGESMQKQFYLPDAHTDFIFAIVGEELGVAASLLVIVLYFAIFNCGIRLSFRAPEMFGRLICFGVTLMITVQAAINIGVVSGVLPTKGLTLPFISFGGSSMVISLAMVGLLINIATQADGGDESRYIKDRARRV